MRTTSEFRATMIATAAGAAMLAVASQPARGVELLESLTLDVAATGIYQAGAFEPIHDDGQLTNVIDATLTYRPTERDTFSATASFAENNALNDVAPVSLAPFADDLEDDLKDLSNRDRDYLLTAWYQHVFAAAACASISCTRSKVRARP